MAEVKVTEKSAPTWLTAGWSVCGVWFALGLLAFAYGLLDYRLIYWLHDREIAVVNWVYGTGRTSVPLNQLAIWWRDHTTLHDVVTGSNWWRYLLIVMTPFIVWGIAWLVVSLVWGFLEPVVSRIPISRTTAIRPSNQTVAANGTVVTVPVTRGSVILSIVQPLMMVVAILALFTIGMRGLRQWDDYHRELQARQQMDALVEKLGNGTIALDTTDVNNAIPILENLPPDSQYFRQLRARLGATCYKLQQDGDTATTKKLENVGLACPSNASASQVPAAAPLGQSTQVKVTKPVGLNDAFGPVQWGMLLILALLVMPFLLFLHRGEPHYAWWQSALNLFIFWVGFAVLTMFLYFKVAA